MNEVSTPGHHVSLQIALIGNQIPVTETKL